jgi:NAD-dependent deacetylase
MQPEDMTHRSEVDAAIREAAQMIGEALHLVAFTGAGISVESGVPPFRGPGGLWSVYDPSYLELSYLHQNPEHCWSILKSLFYEHFAEATPNEAHLVLARLEKRGLLKAVVTQNIDNLHRLAGSARIIEFHGNTRELVCQSCGAVRTADPRLLEVLPPHCGCGGVLKPNCIFFGEEIPREAWTESGLEMEVSDVVLVVGSTGEVFPAASLPHRASNHGARIVEINPEKSKFTASIADVFIPLPAAVALSRIERLLEG